MLRRIPNVKGYAGETRGDFVVQGEGVGLCQIQGTFGEPDKAQVFRNTKQEDAISAGSMQGFPDLEATHQEDALRQTIHTMQAKHGQTEVVGSTLCSLVSWVDPQSKTLKGLTGNVGDSFACFVIISKEGEVRFASQLNALHENTDRAKLKIGVSRSIGDKAQEKNGLTHHPDIMRYDIPLQEGDQVFGIVACDGLSTENKFYKRAALSPNDIAEVVKNNREKSPADIAQALVAAAYQEGYGSTDNISVGVVAIGKIPTVMVVADGHGGVEHVNDKEESGAEVAQSICDDFHPTLQQNMRYIAKFNLLVNAVNALANNYHLLGGARHSKDMQRLLHDINMITINDSLNAQEKFERMIKIIELAFNKEKEHFCKPLMFLGKPRSPGQFVERVNAKYGEYHYPRLLAILLQAAYKSEPDLLKASNASNIVDSIKLGSDRNGVYEKMIDSLIGVQDKKHYEDFAGKIKASGALLEGTQIFRLYMGQDILDTKLAVKIWPELKKYEFDSDTLANFVTGSKGSARALSDDLVRIKSAIDLIRNTPQQMTARHRLH